MKNSVMGSDKVYFLSNDQTCEMVNLSISTINRMVREGSFPKKVKLSPNRVGFRLSDVEKWVGGVR
tara:strand:- start:475 stop:672 length:198 start_codon:yes stop_codon:yes gene_type:complete